jgi:poly-gamma-glutamate synthesis protein (capsule biosynthesis protein)
MKLSFIGDIMLSRFIGEKYTTSSEKIISTEVMDILNTSDYVIANLESPVSEMVETEFDHLLFKADPQLLSQFTFIDCFVLANNHINDCGTKGMNETISHLDNYNISYTGLYKIDYTPYIIEEGENKIAVITCTDMMNEDFASDCPWKVLKIDEKLLDEKICTYKNDGYFVILYAHVGLLFTRFPNPPIRKLLYDKIDLGADAIITVHPHVLGGHESYKDKPIFYSIGDFVMDGSSFRRRKASILELNIEGNKLSKWNLTPTMINKDLKTIIPREHVKTSILKSWNYVSKTLNNHVNDYESLFPKLYKKEMYQHSVSTLKFLLLTKGIGGTLKLVKLRIDEVKRMMKWSKSDRSNLRRDDDAIDKDRKRFSAKNISS